MPQMHVLLLVGASACFAASDDPDERADGAPRSIEVSVKQCAEPAELCFAVESVPCALVVLEDQNGQEVDRAYTDINGSATFEGLRSTPYNVTLRRRDGNKARIVVNGTKKPATLAVTPSSRGAVWADFAVADHGGDAITACSPVRGLVTLESASSESITPTYDIGWNWVVELAQESREPEFQMLMFVHQDASHSGEAELSFAFSLVTAGRHMLRFHRVDVPESAQRYNVDAAEILRDFAARGIDAAELPFTVRKAGLPNAVAADTLLTDPLTP